MLEEQEPVHEQLLVFRLSSVGDRVVERLLNRGVRADSIPDIVEGLRTTGLVFEPSQLIDNVFQPSTDPNHSTPFNPNTRFSDGSEAVFYSAIQDETAIAEVQYHQTQSGEFREIEITPSASPRHFWLYEVDFEGRSLDLFPIYPKYPELTSRDSDGYPRCREIAVKARETGANALRTPSARRTGGTCTPVFDRACLADAPRLRGSGRFVHADGQVQFIKD